MIKNKNNKKNKIYNQYIDDVLSNKIQTGRLVKLACKRHLEDLKTGKARGIYFDEDEADRVIRFFNLVRFYEGAFAGQRFVLQPWQAFIVASIFGWKNKDGSRRFLTAYVEVAKGSGKTPVAAVIGLYGLVADGEAGAEIYSAAVTREQAGITFRDAKNMAESSPSLAKRLLISANNIAYLAKQSFFRAVSSEHRGLDGKRPYIALIDEVHEHQTGMVIDKMRAGTKGRRSPLIFEITNSGYDKNSVCWHHHDYSQKILEGIIDNDSWFAYVCGLDVCQKCADEGKTMITDDCPDCDDWRDKKVWLKANPNLGISIKEKYLEQQVQEAIDMPSKQNIVKRLNFCIWCVVPETLVTMADGTRRRADELQQNDIILSFDEITGSLVSATVQRVANNGEQPIFKITTARGRITKVTGNHKFWVRTGRTDSPRYGWMEAQHLSLGSRIAVALGNNVLNDTNMDVGEAYILGVMIGDGSCKGSPRVTNEEMGIINACNFIMKKHGCEFCTQSNKKHHHVRQLKRSTRGSWLINVLKQHGLYGSDCYSKRVPESVFKGNMDIWSAFLSGYLDTDGYILKQAVAWCSINQALLADCQHILALMGVNASLNSVSAPHCKDGLFWRLEVRDDRSIKILIDCLNPVHPQKHNKLKKLNPNPTYNGISSGNTRKFDRIKMIELLPPAQTVGIEINGTHTHITDGLITHNTESETRWIGSDKWDACASTYTEESLNGKVCYGGLDLSSIGDLTAFALIFPPMLEGERYKILCRFWLPEEKILERSRKDKIPYDMWVRQGHIMVTPGNAIDYAFVIKTIQDDAKKFGLGSIAFDRWGSTKIIQDLHNLGFEDPSETKNATRTLIDFGQGFASMSSPTKELEKMILKKEIEHPNNPVLNWMLSNAIITYDPAGNIKVDKSKSTEKVDGVIAVIMGLDLALRNQTEGEPSITIL